MKSQLRFILNNNIVKVENNLTQPLLDFIRYEENLTGTKIGCREGDCGACTVLIGSINGDHISYQSVVSCLTPVGNVIGKHVVTIEGLNLEQSLTPIQRAIVENNGTQCGACTPGFIVSLTGQVLLYDEKYDPRVDLLQSIDGNICRCTGYKSIQRAIETIADRLSKTSDFSLEYFIENNYIPAYFNTIYQKLTNLSEMNVNLSSSRRILGGGTDLYVQMRDKLIKEEVNFIGNLADFDLIDTNNGWITIGSSSTSTQIMNSSSLQEIIPKITDYFELIASMPIRNIATIGGNIVNASPIADMVIFFLPFRPKLSVINTKSNQIRKVDLASFYLGYKTLDLHPDEILKAMLLKIPIHKLNYSFAKVSKRKILDIASVNSAVLVETDKNEVVMNAAISAGGVAPIPKLLEKSSEWLIGKSLSTINLHELLVLIQTEISPISDIRGSKEYKALLLERQIIGHFTSLFPKLFNLEEFLKP